MPRKENDKRKEILLASVRVFAQGGFFNSKVSDVAKQAGVADGTIYLYFRNKDDLLISLFDQTMEEFVTRAAKALAAIRDPVEKLRQLARLHLDSLGRNRQLAIVFQIELRHSSKFMAQFSMRGLADYFDLLRSVIREGQQSGRFRKEIHEKIATKCFFGALDEMATNWILSKRHYDLAAMADPVVDIFVHGLEVPRSSTRRGCRSSVLRLAALSKKVPRSKSRSS